MANQTPILPHVLKNRIGSSTQNDLRPFWMPLTFIHQQTIWHQQMQAWLQPKRDNWAHSHSLQPLQQASNTASGNLSPTQPPTYTRQHPHQSKDSLLHTKIFTECWIWIEKELQLNQQSLRSNKNQRIQILTRFQLLQTWNLQPDTPAPTTPPPFFLLSFVWLIWKHSTGKCTYLKH